MSTEAEKQAYITKWRAHVAQLHVLKFNLSVNGSLDLEACIATLESLIEAAGQGYQSYLVAKQTREEA